MDAVWYCGWGREHVAAVVVEVVGVAGQTESSLMVLVVVHSRVQVSSVGNGTERSTCGPWVWTRGGIVGEGKTHVAVVVVEVVGVAGQTESSLMVLVVVHSGVQVSSTESETGRSIDGAKEQTCCGVVGGGRTHVAVVVVEVVGVAGQTETSLMVLVVVHS